MVGNHVAVKSWRSALGTAAFLFLCGVIALGSGEAAGESVELPLTSVSSKGRVDVEPLWVSLLTRPDQPPHVRSSETVALGARLFTDTRLSAEGTRSCATCHKLEQNFTDGEPLALGSDGEPGKRNTPTLWGIGLASRLNWDGSASSLEEQAKGPIADHRELGAGLDLVVSRLRADPSLTKLFAGIYGLTSDGQSITGPRLLDALATYQQSLNPPETPFDRWLAGDLDAITDNAKNGFLIFAGSGQCVTCHSGWRFTDDQLHDVGLRRNAAGGAALRGTQMKTPTLRQLRFTAPYMHDGRFATLTDVVRHYSDRVVTRSSLSPNLARNLLLEPSEVADLVAFLESLSSPE